MDNDIIKIFCEKLNSIDKIPKENIKKILKKGKSVISGLDEIKDANDRVALLIGHVQSGKTVNFMSIMANAILQPFNYKIIVVLTSTIDRLHNQTVKRIKDSFAIDSDLRNLIKLFDLREQETKKYFKTHDFTSDIKNELDNDVILIFTILKEHRNISNFHQFIDKNKEQFSKFKFLIIDDEGDDASVSNDKDDKTRKTHENINKLFNTLVNKSYISVTATPYAQMMLNKNDTLMPRRVYCIEPGDGYKGLDVFCDERYFKIIDENDNNIDWGKTDIFEECLIYYYIIWALYFKNNNLNKSNARSYMMIHTNIKKWTHVHIKEQIKNFKHNYLEYLESKNKNELSYVSFVDKLEKIIKKYNIDKQLNGINLLQDNDFLEKLIFSIKRTAITCLNEDENNKNESFSNILIGSKKLERGITIENLLTTFFTNKAKNSIPIDTFLQRSRWFGYRNQILDYMKIFTTKAIFECIEEVRIIHNNIMKILNDAEKEKRDFREIDRAIFATKNNKLRPTNRVPLKDATILSSAVQATPWYSKLLETKNEYNNLVEKLLDSNEYVTFNEKYKFKSLFFNDIESCINEFPQITKILDIDDDWKKLVNTWYNNPRIIISLLNDPQNNLQPRDRKFIYQKEEHDYSIVQLSQGRSEDNIKYKGDKNWFDHDEDKNIKDSIIIQIHHLQPSLEKNDNNYKGEDVFSWMVLYPKSEKLIKWQSKNQE